MKILLILPSDNSDIELSPSYLKHGRFKVLHDHKRFQRIIALPPLGLMYLVPSLLQAGHDVQILDAYTLQLNVGEITHEALMFQPDLIGISFYSRFIRIVYTLTNNLKTTIPCPIVVGGAHPTAMPDEVLGEFHSVDYLVRGWGEAALAQLAEHLSSKRSIQNIDGLCYRDGNRIQKNSEAALPKNLDDIPMPNRDLLKPMYDNHLYFNITSRRKNMDVLMTSRNCPFFCNFCFQHWPGSYYMHSADRVIAEINEMTRRGINSIEIMDDNFTLNKNRTEEIIDKIIAQKYELEFRIRSRVNQIDEKLLKRLKKMGVRAINYGMESGSDAMLKQMNKKTTAAQNEKACRLTKKAGILCQSSWLFGYPGETKERLNETLAFIRRILPDNFTFSVLTPLPQTHVYLEAKKNGTLIGDWSVHNEQIYVKNPEFPNFDEYDTMINTAQRKIMRSFRYVFQTFKYLVRHPNPKLFSYGVKIFTGKIKQIRAMRDPKGKKIL